MIPIRFINKSNIEKYIGIRAMIDSGANASIFPTIFGKKIGLNIKNVKLEKTYGIGGQLV